MSFTVNVWYASDLTNGGFTLNIPTMGTSLDISKYYEVMPDPSGGYSLQEWLLDYSSGGPEWTPLNDPIPASTTISYTDEADMISRFNAVGGSPAHTMIMESTGGPGSGGGYGSGDGHDSGGDSASADVSGSMLPVQTLATSIQGLAPGDYVIEGNYTDGIKAYAVTGSGSEGDPYVKSPTSFKE